MNIDHLGCPKPCLRTTLHAGLCLRTSLDVGLLMRQPKVGRVACAQPWLCGVSLRCGLCIPIECMRVCFFCWRVCECVCVLSCVCVCVCVCWSLVIAAQQFSFYVLQREYCIFYWIMILGNMICNVFLFRTYRNIFNFRNMFFVMLV